MSIIRLFICAISSFFRFPFLGCCNFNCFGLSCVGYCTAMVLLDKKIMLLEYCCSLRNMLTRFNYVPDLRNPAI